MRNLMVVNGIRDAKVEKKKRTEEMVRILKNAIEMKRTKNDQKNNNNKYNDFDCYGNVER